jgi:hypothetical protein
MDIEEIIKEYIEPRKVDECKRLGIPPEFILDIKGGYLDLFEGAKCIPTEKEGKIIGVEIIINCDEKRPRGARGDFFHEMRHAKKYYENESNSELGAYLYMIKRGIQEDYKTVVSTLKKYLLLSKDKKSI